MFHANFCYEFLSKNFQVYDIINKIDDDTGHLDFQVRPIKPNFVIKLFNLFFFFSQEKDYVQNLRLCSIIIWNFFGLSGVHLHHDRAEQGQRSGEQLQGGFQVTAMVVSDYLKLKNL